MSETKINKEEKPIKQSSNIPQIVMLMLASIIIFLAGGFTFWFFSEKISKKEPSPTPSISPSPLASPSPVATQPSTGPVEPAVPQPSTAPQAPSTSDLDLLRQAFANKYNHPVADAQVTISKMNIPYASGGIKFAGQEGGGWFLAYKSNGNWTIVADGNGTISCELIEPYNFPKDMVPECWSDKTSKLITR